MSKDWEALRYNGNGAHKSIEIEIQFRFFFSQELYPEPKAGRHRKPVQVLSLSRVVLINLMSNVYHDFASPLCSTEMPDLLFCPGLH